MTLRLFHRNLLRAQCLPIQSINETGYVKKISEPLGKWIEIEIAIIFAIIVGFLLHKFEYMRYKTEMRLPDDRMQLNFLTSLKRCPWAYRALGQQEPLMIADAC